MFKLLFIMMTFLVLYPASECLALSDEEYKVLMQAPQFKKAEQELAKQWKQTYSSVSASDRKTLLEIQRAWIRLGRDDLAQKFQQAGLSREDAYTMATFRRIGDLQVYEYNSYLPDEEKGAARADGFYDDAMDQRAVAVIQEFRQPARTTASTPPAVMPDNSASGNAYSPAPSQYSASANAGRANLPPAPPVQKSLAITARQLSRDYNENEFASDNKYKGKQITVTGAVLEVSKGFMDEGVYIVLHGADLIGTVACEMENTAGLEVLGRGDLVEVEGVCKGLMLATVHLDKCHLRSLQKM